VILSPYHVRNSATLAGTCGASVTLGALADSSDAVAPAEVSGILGTAAAPAVMAMVAIAARAVGMYMLKGLEDGSRKIATSEAVLIVLSMEKAKMRDVQGMQFLHIGERIKRSSKDCFFWWGKRDKYVTPNSAKHGKGTCFKLVLPLALRIENLVLRRPWTDQSRNNYLPCRTFSTW